MRREDLWVDEDAPTLVMQRPHRAAPLGPGSDRSVDAPDDHAQVTQPFDAHRFWLATENETIVELPGHSLDAADPKTLPMATFPSMSVARGTDEDNPD